MDETPKSYYKPYKRKRVGKIELTREDGTVYLRRWYIFRFKPISMRLHHIMEPDVQEPHDHPYSFVSFILKGGYNEMWREADDQLPFLPRRIRRFSFHRGDDLHRITDFINGKDSWSLVITGRENRVWGFLTDKGWVSHIDMKAGGIL